jgi:hypothetical protein
MNGPSFHIHTDDEDDVMELRPNDFSRPSFQIPRGGMGMGGTASVGGAGGMDMLMNRRKISSDVISMASSDSGSIASGSDSGSTASGSDSGSEYDSGSGSDASGSRGGTPMVYPGNAGIFAGRPPAANNGPVMPSMNPDQDYLASRMSAERARAEQELNEKKEILYQMDRLEAKGYKLPRKFSLQSDLEEMRVEFSRIVREKEVDASIRFQRKMMMAFVTGVEFLNTRFDPFDIRLDGWSEKIHDDITDYDDIFEELHEKYKSTGKKMAPELRLLLSLSGSAFTFHLTNSMFKSQPLPGVEQVLRSNPELMKQFQAEAARHLADIQSVSGGSGAAGAGAGAGMSQRGGGGGGMFGMIGNLFGSMTAPSQTPMSAMPPQPSRMPSYAQPTRENVESVISQVHSQVRSRPPSNGPQIETLSAISDEEITSIIEDTADMVGLVGGSTGGSVNGQRRRGRPVGSGGSVKRTLDL